MTDNVGATGQASTTATVTGGASQQQPVGYWKFDEGSGLTANDSSLNSNVGALVNGPTWIAGRVNSALNFDGVDDYVQVGVRPTLMFSNQLTLSAWIKPGASVFGAHTILNQEGEYELAVHDGQIAWAIANISPGWNWVFTGYVPPQGSWTHIALTYDGSTIRTYANGIQVHAQAGSGNIIDASAEDDFRIGSRQCGICVEYFHGGIDEVRVYNRTLTPAEIQALVNVGNTPPTVSITGTTPAAPLPRPPPFQ